MPAYACIAFVVGRYHDKAWDDPLVILVISTLVVLVGLALMQLFLLPFGTSLGHVIFQLAVVDTQGRLASRARLASTWVVRR